MKLFNQIFYIQRWIPWMNEWINAGSQIETFFNLKWLCKATNTEAKAIQTFSKHNEFFKINCCKLGDVCRIGFENGPADSFKQSLEAIGYNKSGLWRNHFGRMSVISTIRKRNKILHCYIYWIFFDLVGVPKTKSIKIISFTSHL